MPTPPSLRQAGRVPRAGALFADDIVATNVLRLRIERNWTQNDLAQRMHALGHATWKQGVVSRFERLGRAVGLSEVQALALVFGVPPTVLIDPVHAGAELDLGGPGVIGGGKATHWLSGLLALQLTWDGEGYRPGCLDVVRV